MHLGEWLQRFTPFVLVQVESLHGGRQAALVFGLLMPLPNQLGKSFRLGFHTIRAIEPDQRLRRQIGKNRAELRVKVRNQRLHPRKGNALTQRLEQTVFLPPLDFQVRGPLVDLAQNLV